MIQGTHFTKTFGSLYNRKLLHGKQWIFMVNGRANRYLSAGPRVASNNTHNEERPFSEIPGPKGIPGLGTIYKYLPGGEYCTINRTDADWKKFTKYGEIIKEEIFKGEAMVYLFHPDDFQQVYSMEGKYPFRGEFKGMVKYCNDRGMPLEVGSRKGKSWAEMRRPMSQVLLKPKVLAQYIPEQDLVARSFIKVILDKRDSSPNFNIVPELYKYTAEAISVMLYNKRLGLMKPNLDPLSEEIFRNINHIMDGLYHSMFFWPLHKSGRSKIWKRFVGGLDYTYNLGDQYISEGLQNDANSEDKASLARQLMNAGSSEEDAILAVNSLLMAAFDTTGNTLAFLLYNLASHPEKQETLYQIIKERFPCRDEPLPVGGIREMSYLKACLKESMRLMPTTTGNLRILSEDIVIRNYRIPAGTAITMQNAVTARREELFTSPDQFVPERFLRGEGHKMHPYAAIPFSRGVRMCPGMRFAEQEIFLATIRILQHFRIEYTGAPVKIKSKLLNVPSRPLVLSFIDRD